MTADTTLAGRYLLESLLGRGAHGEVWRARDLVADAAVAVKFLDSTRSKDSARAIREGTLLRLVREPGVVRLFDEGLHGDRRFLVMDLVEGAPFPGRAGPMTWRELKPIALSLIETLARVHAAGVVHRDLKPANVLVGSCGRVTLLDFSISQYVQSTRNDITMEGMWHGSPSYLSMEQLLGDPASTASDVYAVGVMLFEALAGRLPYGSTSTLRSRMSEPVPFVEATKDLPRHVADAVALAMSPDPKARPGTGQEFVDRLIGVARQSIVPRWLGLREKLESAIAVLSSGKAVDIIGPPRSGRTRFLSELRMVLERAGRRVFETRSAEDPFASLSGLPGLAPIDANATLFAATATIKLALVHFLESGGVLLADDVTKLDRQTRNAIESLGSARSIVRAERERRGDREVIELRGFKAETLRSLFTGRDRVFHEVEDAANQLYMRTGGLPGLVFDELRSWERMGIATPLADGISVRREGIDALDTGVITPPTSPAVLDVVRNLAPHEREVLGWILLTSPAQADRLLELTLLVRWDLEASIDSLSSSGLIATDDRGDLLPLGSLRVRDIWHESRLSEARQVLNGTTQRPGRGWIRSMGDAPDLSLPEFIGLAIASAQDRIEVGKWGAAAALLEEASRLVRSAEGLECASTLCEEVFSIWSEMFGVDTSPKPVARALYELERHRIAGRPNEQLELLTRATLDLHQDRRRALRALRSIGPMSNPAWERSRCNVMLIAANSMSDVDDRSVLDEVTESAEMLGDDDMRARLLGWRARIEYREEKYPEALELQLQAAALMTRPFDQANALTYAASAALEYDCEAALELVGKAAICLRDLRHPILEARVEWIGRASLYRLGRTTGCDLELVEAARDLGVGTLHALICVTEGAAAWRAGQLNLASILAREAELEWRQLNAHPEAAAASQALAIAARLPIDDVEVELAASKASDLRMLGFGLQVLGLIALSHPHITTRFLETARELWSQVPPARRGLRMDILSPDEAYEAIVKSAQAPA